jgi:hypothetical protein
MPNHRPEYTMTIHQSIARSGLAEKGANTDLPREVIQHVVQLETEVERRNDTIGSLLKDGADIRFVGARRLERNQESPLQVPNMHFDGRPSLTGKEPARLYSGVSWARPKPHPDLSLLHHSPRRDQSERFKDSRTCVCIRLFSGKKSVIATVGYRTENQ